MDEKYSYSIPTWLIILITVLVTLMIETGITIFLYCKHKNAPTHFKSLPIFWHEENPRITKLML